MIQNKNIEHPLQKLILLSVNMFDYIVRLLVRAVEGVYDVLLHPVGGVQVCLDGMPVYRVNLPFDSFFV